MRDQHRTASLASAPPRRPDAAPRRARRPRRCRTTPGWRSKFANWSSAARWTRRASASTVSSPPISAARSRIAYQYLRDAAEADEAVQDAFVKVFAHIGSYREAWPFEVWFTRILINGCLDRRKARGAPRPLVRSGRDATAADERDRAAFGGIDRQPDPEARLLARERRARLAAAIDRLEAGSARSSCCATTATARRARSAR